MTRLIDQKDILDRGGTSFNICNCLYRFPFLLYKTEIGEGDRPTPSPIVPFIHYNVERDLITI